MEKQRGKQLSHWALKMPPLPTEAPASLLNPSCSAALWAKESPWASSPLSYSQTKFQRQQEALVF